MNRRLLTAAPVVAAFCIIAIASRCDEAEEVKKPNVVVILVDDAGYADFGFMGCQDLETPNIDRLARQGVVLTDAHVSATVCAPSRAGIMTGRYQQRFGFECNGTGPGLGLDPNEKTVADRMREAGYFTVAVGKWHLGDRDPYRPNARGFDEFYGFRGGGRSYFPIENPNPNHALRHNGEPVTFEGYLTDNLGERAAQYVAEAEKPVFLYFAPNAVHTPMEATEEDLARYEGHPRQTLAAMTWALDRSVGTIVQAIKDKGEYDNTLFFFLSDNGGAHNNQSENGPLKGWKGNKFEGGHRVAFFATWPERLEGGQRYMQLASSLDIAATALAAAGKPVPEALDGVDLLPYLNGEQADAPHDRLYWRKLEATAIREGYKKLVSLEGHGQALYDLSEDLGETDNLRERNPEEAQRLTQAIQQWAKGLVPPLWKEEPEWMEVTYDIHRYLIDGVPPPYQSPSERDVYLASEK